MPTLAQQIEYVLQGFEEGHAGVDKAVKLLKAVHDAGSTQERVAFFEQLTASYFGAPIKQGSRHVAILRAWAAFGPPERFFAAAVINLDTGNPVRAKAWAAEIGPQLTFLLHTYRRRFLGQTLKNITNQCAHYTKPAMANILGHEVPSEVIKVVREIERTIGGIEFERESAGIEGRAEASAAANNMDNEAELIIEVEEGEEEKTDRWERIRSLSEGGQARIFEVRDRKKEFKGRFALKMLKNVDDPKRRGRFIQEVDATQGIRYPNILRIVDKKLDGEEPYYVSELCSGGSLEKLGAVRFRGDLSASLKILIPVVDALVAASAARVVHRDIKPSNILLRDNETPVVGDFGICFIEGNERMTVTDEAVGSRNFIAPEMESGHGHLGGPSDKTDVYSLGKLIYWMLSGGYESAREDLRSRSLVMELGDERFEHVHALLDKMVVQEPERRIGIDRVREELIATAKLVIGNYAPLRPRAGIKCRFCGIGYYQQRPSRAGYPISELGLSLPAGSDVRVLVCGNCGHVELFKFEGLADKSWWEK